MDPFFGAFEKGVFVGDLHLGNQSRSLSRSWFISSTPWTSNIDTKNYGLEDVLSPPFKMAVFGVYVKIWGCNPFDFVLTILLNRSIDQFGNDNWSVFFKIGGC